MAFENDKNDTVNLTSDEQDALVKLLKHPEILKLIKTVEDKEK